MASMNAAVLEAWGAPLVMSEVARPQPATGEVLLKVKACSVDAFDVTISEGRMRDQSALPNAKELPLILGHEFAGEVASLGDGVGHIAVGDRVAAYILLLCGHCRACRIGRESLCANFGGYIGFQVDGGLAEYAVIPARNAIPLPPSVSYEAASILGGGLGSAYHATIGQMQVRAGETVVIVGAAGGVGAHAVQLAKLAGARVIAVDVSDERLASLKELGADEVFNSKGGEYADAVLELTDGRGAEKVLDIVGTESSLSESYRSAAIMSRIVVMGGAPGAKMLIDPISLLWKEAEIVGTRASRRQDLADAIALMDSGVLKAIISETRPLAAANSVLAQVKANEVYGRVVLQP